MITRRGRQERQAHFQTRDAHAHTRCMPSNGDWEAGGERGEAVSKRRRRRRKKATGTHVSKKGFLGFLQEEGEGARGWSAWGQRASGRGRGGESSSA